MKENRSTLQYMDNPNLEDVDILTVAANIIKEHNGRDALHKMVNDIKKKDIQYNLIKHDPVIVDVTDKDGRRAFDMANPVCKEAMEKALRLFDTVDDSMAVGTKVTEQDVLI